MAIHKLTAARIAKLNKDGVYSDGGNLYLQVRNGGAAKSWLFRWAEPTVNGVRGRERVMGLGPAHTIDLDEARELARAQRKLLLQHLDPKEVRDGVKINRAKEAARNKTLNQVADEFLESKTAHLSKGRRERLAQVLRDFVRNTIGKQPIQDIDTKAILTEAGLAELWLTQYPTAAVLRGSLNEIFNYAIAHQYFKGDNPARWEGCMKHALPVANHKVVNLASLPHGDVGRFLRMLRTRRVEAASGGRIGEYPTMAMLLEFVILSGAPRISEARLATWSEIDGANMIWTVPPDHHKTGSRSGRQIERPISSAMAAILAEMRRRHPDYVPTSPVFPSPRGGHLSPYSRESFTKFLERLDWPLHITNHGFRNTFTDWCRENGVPKELYDMQLGHSVGNKVAQAYACSQLVDQRRPLMEAWAQYCTQQPAPEQLGAQPLLVEYKEVENESD